MSTRFLTRQDVIIIHDDILPCPLIREDLLDSAVMQPQSSWGRIFFYQTLAEQAAALLRSLASNHPFADANKRTAWLATQVFLNLNQSPLHQLPDDEVVDFMVCVVENHLGIAPIAEWLTYRFDPRHQQSQ